MPVVNICDLKPSMSSGNKNAKLRPLFDIASLDIGQALRFPGLSQGTIRTYISCCHCCGFALGWHCGVEMDGTVYVKRCE